jgi:hypothetical protein
MKMEMMMIVDIPGQIGTVVNDRIRRNTDRVRSFTSVYGFRNRRPGMLIYFSHSLQTFKCTFIYKVFFLPRLFLLH